MTAAVINIALCLLISSSSPPEEIISPFNDRVLSLDSGVKEYSFLVAGHIYGSHNESIYPSASILANIDLLVAMHPDFMILLGDIVREPNDIHLQTLKNSFLHKLDFPVFNAPGNHDLAEREWYTDRVGETYFSFQQSSELFLILDGEINDGKILGKQLDFLTGNIEKFKNNPDLKNVLIFSHRLLWAIGNPPYDRIIPFVNGPHHHPEDATTIAEVVIPMLKSLNGKYAYFFGGDVGTFWSLPLFFEKDKESNISYIATGIGDTASDLVLEVTAGNGRIRFKPVSLTGKKFSPIEEYDLLYWEKHFRTPALTKYKDKVVKVMTNKFFWVGVTGTLFLGMIVFAVVRFNRS